MAVFTDNDLGRLDWRLMQNGAVVLYYRGEILDEDLHWLKEHGYRIVDFDCSRWKALDDFFTDVYVSIGFPKPILGNLDGLNDYLSQVEVPMESGCVLVLRRYHAFASLHRSFAQTVLDIIATNSRGKLLFGERFFALVQSDDPRIQFDPVGEGAVLWNPREWLNSSRGV